MRDFSIRFDREHYGKKLVMLSEDEIWEIKGHLAWCEDEDTGIGLVLRHIIKQVSE